MDVATSIKAFCLSGVDGESGHPLPNIQTLMSILLGVIGKLVKHKSQLRAEVVALITSKLRTFLFYPALKNSLNYILGATSKGDANQMMYKDFDCQECSKNSALFAQFLLTSLTYDLLSYFVCLHCANFHTPLPFLSYPYDLQNMKTRHSHLFGAKEDL